VTGKITNRREVVRADIGEVWSLVDDLVDIACEEGGVGRRPGLV